MRNIAYAVSDADRLRTAMAMEVYGQHTADASRPEALDERCRDNSCPNVCAGV